MTTHYAYIFFLLFSFFHPFLLAQQLTVKPCTIAEPTADHPPGNGNIKAVIDELVQQQIPGAVAAIHSPKGWWTYAAGYAKIEDETPMEVCHLQYLQSIAKTYMAVGTLKLYEAGRIALDAPIADYLPEKTTGYLTDANKITVRMLLNHTSGLPEYNYHPAYVTKLLQQPKYVFQPIEYLRYIKGKALDFEPGSRYAYRNVNYVLLALIADHLTGDHGQWLRQVIFEPLDLQHTFYQIPPGYTYENRLVNSYWDRHGNSILENVSTLQNTNVASMVGDDGIICTPMDAVRFLKGLLEGELLQPETLAMMQEWVTNDGGEPAYGLGLSRIKIHGQTGIGHSGGGIGAGCQLYYFPEREVYVFLGINLGTVTDSPIHAQAAKTVERIYEAIFSE